VRLKKKLLSGGRNLNVLCCTVQARRAIRRRRKKRRRRRREMMGKERKKWIPLALHPSHTDPQSGVSTAALLCRLVFPSLPLSFPHPFFFFPLPFFLYLLFPNPPSLYLLVSSPTPSFLLHSSYIPFSLILFSPIPSSPCPNLSLSLAKYNHRPEVLGNIKREMQGILSDALAQRGLSKVEECHLDSLRSFINVL